MEEIKKNALTFFDNLDPASVSVTVSLKLTEDGDRVSAEIVITSNLSEADIKTTIQKINKEDLEEVLDDSITQSTSKRCFDDRYLKKGSFVIETVSVTADGEEQFTYSAGSSVFHLNQPLNYAILILSIIKFLI
jgi:hypothetical protein